MANAAPDVFNDKTSGMIIPGNSASVKSEILYDSDGKLALKHDPEKDAACIGCNRWFLKEEMIEVRLGLIICPECRWNPLVLGKLEVTEPEFFRIFNGICEGCGNVLEKEDLTFVTPGGNLCLECLSAKGWFKKQRA